MAVSALALFSCKVKELNGWKGREVEPSICMSGFLDTYSGN